jgi:muramoyltetrapeptide carboxypeptidase
MLDLLDWAALAAAGPKVLVGFSDITALHQAFAVRLGLSTIHGPVVASLGDGDEESAAHLHRMLFTPSSPAASLRSVPAATLVPGAAEGILVGGNLAMLAASVGTRDLLPAAGGIAVLEDIGEELYRLDRMFTQLLRAGWFDGVRGVALGDFTGPAPLEAVHGLALDRLCGLGVPVLAGLPVGHERRNLAFPLGVPARLDADAGTLVLRQPALR